MKEKKRADEDRGREEGKRGETDGEVRDQKYDRRETEERREMEQK